MSFLACMHRRRRVHETYWVADLFPPTVCDCRGVAPCEVVGCSGRASEEERRSPLLGAAVPGFRVPRRSGS